MSWDPQKHSTILINLKNMVFSSLVNRKNINPKKIGLDASTVCQLKCPSCPTATGETGKKLGKGFLQFKDFKEIVDKNPQLHSIELSNWGEIFLNKELPKIIEYAYVHNVALSDYGKDTFFKYIIYYAFCKDLF